MPSLTIRTRLFIWFLLVSVIPLTIIGSFSYYLIFNKISKQNEEHITNINKGIYNMVDTQQKVLSRWLESSRASFSSKLAAMGKSTFDYENKVEIGGFQLPAWYIGQQKITGNFELVDSLIEREKLPATIFQYHNKKFVRVSTNVRQPDGMRIMGTYIDSGPVYERLINGQQFIGRASVEGIWHSTIYQPLWDSDGNLIGAFVLGRKEQEYEIVNGIKDIVIGSAGYVFVMDPNGVAIIHPSHQGQTLAHHRWIQEILHKKNGNLTYEDPPGQKKIAYYIYYEPWNWYIVSGGYVNEIFTNTRELSELLLLTVLLVIGISSLFAFTLSRTFSQPINEFMSVMRNCQSGNLSARLTHMFDDEFRVLSSAFNSMLNNISLLIGRILSTSAKLKDASSRLMSDISESNNSLKGIETCMENFRQAPVRESADLAYLQLAAGVQTDLQQAVAHAHMVIDSALQTRESEQLERIKLALERVDSLSRLYTTTQRELYLNKINGLDVEVQKLKLLLRNISSSASSLDDIALSLDRHVNVFKIDQPE